MKQIGRQKRTIAKGQVKDATLSVWTQLILDKYSCFDYFGLRLSHLLANNIGFPELGHIHEQHHTCGLYFCHCWLAKYKSTLTQHFTVSYSFSCLWINCHYLWLGQMHICKYVQQFSILLFNPQNKTHVCKNKKAHTYKSAEPSSLDLHVLPAHLRGWVFKLKPKLSNNSISLPLSRRDMRISSADWHMEIGDASMHITGTTHSQASRY